MNTLRLTQLVTSLLATAILSACVTTAPRQDGSTEVRITNPFSQTAPSAAGASTASTSTPRGAEQGRTLGLPPISATALSGLFAKHPYDGTPKSYFPRVALTVTDWSRSDCWTATAVIWWNTLRSENVPAFNVCFNDRQIGAAGAFAPALAAFMTQGPNENTGNVRTTGPNPPSIAVPPQHPPGKDQVFPNFIRTVIATTGWQGSAAPMNLWLVGYKN